MDRTESNDKVSEMLSFLDVRITDEKYNLIENIGKTKKLVFKVRNERF